MSISLSPLIRHSLAELRTAGTQYKKKILILNVSGPVTLDGIEEDFDAILCTFLPGMQGAAALADILSGNLNPCGKLPLSWPRRIEDLPAYLNFPGDGMQVLYGEGIFVGYRWYDARRIEPLYPFGHGLSYTQFRVTAMCAESAVFSDSVTIRVTVTNTGERAGKTVVQLYVEDPCSTLSKPVRELKAFRKIHLKAGESTELSFTLDRHAFESYDPNLHAWTFEEGQYRIHAGFSSRDLQAQCSVYADVVSPYSYGENTSIKEIMENDELFAAVHGFFMQEALPWSAVLTSYEYTAQDTIGQILSQVGCTEAQKATLCTALRTVKKR